MSSEYRKLVFENLEQAGQEAHRLLESGYTQLGNWNLAQSCQHMSDWMRFPMDGYPVSAPPIRLMLWLMKITMGRRSFKKILANGFSKGTPTLPATVYPAGERSDREAVTELVKTIERLRCHNGAFYPSPLFGHATREELVKLHLHHTAHHLSFLTPNQKS